MAKITRYYTSIAVCQKCYNDLVVSYEIAYDPHDGKLGKCELCGKSAVLIMLKYVTVLVTEKFKNTVKFKSELSI